VNIAAVTDELAEALGAISGLRVSPYWAGAVSTPAAIVGPPESDFDASLGRGADRWTIHITVVVDKIDGRIGRALLSPYCAGSGAGSVKAAVEAFEPTAYDSARVTRFVVGGVDIGGTEYLGATFDVDVIGRN
jgi:hypothetical protein